MARSADGPPAAGDILALEVELDHALSINFALDMPAVERVEPAIYTWTGYMDHPFKNRPLETEKDLLPRLAT